MQVLVRDNNVDQALKVLKKKMQREGVFREMKLRGHYEKPSERKGSHPPRPQARAQEIAARWPATDEALAIQFDRGSVWVRDLGPPPPAPPVHFRG